MIVFDSISPVVTVGVAERGRARPCVLVKGPESLYHGVLLGFSVDFITGHFGFGGIVSFCGSLCLWVIIGLVMA